ncbi:hypothetical protein [Duganella sp. CF458]|uniref:hypothetical protein n=1 Tax=Duganella sp. CF458 TaxID=1884368 RepID=UPI001480481D|nr:hypothetical protein [Duganella sp. CF458]
MEQQAPPGPAINSVIGEYNYEKFAGLMGFLIKNAKQLRQDRARNVRRSLQ